MKTATARWISHAVLGTVLGCVALWAWLNLSFPGGPQHPDEPGIAADVVALALAMLFVLVGGLIVRRHPGNAVGGIFLVLGFIYAEGIALGDYVWASFGRGQSWPLTRSAAYLADVTFQNPAVFGLFAFFFLLFPDGGLPSPRWRPLAYLAGVSMVGLWVNGAFRPDVLNTIPIQNPLGLEALNPFREVLDIVSFGGLVLSLLGSVVSLIVRLRRSRGDQRQQIKWFLTAAVALVTIISIAPFTFFRPDFPVWVWPVVLLGSLSLIPIAAGVAILKYRLYEIDVIINRALVYSVLTAILAATYLGSVVLLQDLLEPLTRESELSVAASTLAVAALFRPLRSRVQAFIDRRFYRRRYDAAETLATFSSRLRDRVDLDSLGHDLVTVVGLTMQPTYISLWLRPVEEGAEP